MTIELYTTLDEANVVGKTLYSRATFEGTLRDETSILRPVFTITTENTIADVNYAYIPDFNRYYFVDEIVFVRNQVFRLSCRVDVLESFKDDILELNGIVARNEGEYDVLLADSNIKIRQNRQYVIKRFSNQPDFDPSFIVVGAGGYGYIIPVPEEASENGDAVNDSDMVNGRPRTMKRTIVRPAT